MTYLVLKALHLLSVVAWMAGMLYLPRLYVYHAEASDQAVKDTLKVMERRLLRGICTPAMLATLAFGIAMVVVAPELMKQGWLHAKFAFVLGLAAFHGFLARSRRAFEKDANVYGPRFWRLVNEVPTIILIAVVFLVVLKPL